MDQSNFVCPYCEKKYLKKRRLIKHLCKLHKVDILPEFDSSDSVSLSDSSSYEDETIESESGEDIKTKQNTKVNKVQDINASKRKISTSESDEEAPDAGFQPPKKTKKVQQAFPLNQNNDVHQYKDNRVTSDSTKRLRENFELPTLEVKNDNHPDEEKALDKNEENLQDLIEDLKEENHLLKEKLERAILQNANEEYRAVVQIWEKNNQELKEVLAGALSLIESLKQELYYYKKSQFVPEKASTNSSDSVSLSDSSSSEDETTLRKNIPVKAKSTVSPLQKKVQEDSSSLESESDEDSSSLESESDEASESDEEAPDAGFQPPKKTKKMQQAFPLNQNNDVHQYKDNRVTSDSTKRLRKNNQELKEVLAGALSLIESLKQELDNYKKNQFIPEKASTSVDVSTQTGERNTIKKYMTE